MSTSQYVAIGLACLLVSWQFRHQVVSLVGGLSRKPDPSGERLSALASLEDARVHADSLGNDLAVSKIDEACRAFYEGGDEKG